MRILVVVKRVPDSRAALKVKPDGSGIDASGLKYVCDPFDEFGVEQAIQLKEQRSDVEEICAIVAGPSQAVEALRYAIAFGADRAVHLHEDALPEHDEIRMARILAAAIANLGDAFDLILTGKQSIDNDAGERGPALAECLGMVHVGAVTALSIAEDGGSLRAHRRIEGAEEVVESPLPALITCEKGLVEPRHPALPKLMKAKKHPIETMTLADLSSLDGATCGTRFVKLAPPPGRPPCQFIEGEPQAMAAELVRRLRQEAKVI